MTAGAGDPGSFRDPSGRVIVRGGRVFRAVMPCAGADFDHVRATGFLERQVAANRVIAEARVDLGLLGDAGEGAYCAVEHPRLPFISYPYEWPFPALKAAALLHLDLSLEALASGVMLSDASAYNVQFEGVRPLFIDTLSFRRYREGEFWLAHHQFCEQFVNPLLLRALLGVPHNAWYRGALEGIETGELNRLLRFRHKLSWNILLHVVLQARMQSRGQARTEAAEQLRSRKLPRRALAQMLRGMRRWIARLEPAKTGKTVWADYAGANGYSTEDAQAKVQLVADYAAAIQPGLLLDIGCNTGAYAETALRHGATRVIGFDSDHGALEGAFARASAKRLDLLPLLLDAANPSPSQGWAEHERAGLLQRASGGDGLLALALIHHLVIARNIPVEQVLDWLIALAPGGIIEFVPPEDPMVRHMLSLRENVFRDYEVAHFERALRERARIVRSVSVGASKRQLYWFERG